MRPVSDSFLATITGSHQAVFRARVLPYGSTGVDPGGGTELPIVDGNVVFDTHADVNATLDLTVVYPWPTSANDILTPYGNEIYIERGVVYGEGTREWVSLGYFRIDSIEQDYTRGLIRITGTDRMSRVRDYRPEAPRAFASGTSVGTVLYEVVNAAVPGVIIITDFNAADTYLTSEHILDDDRIKFLREMLTSYGKIFYFDYAGRLVIRSTPSYETDPPVWNIYSGRNGVLVEFNQSISRDGVYNVVVARGEPIGDQPPVQAVAEDTDPNSPTNVSGSFGRVPRFFSSSFMTTVDQCRSAAQSLLRSSTGLPYLVQLGSVPNPALEGWDVVRVQYSEFADVETHVIDSIYYPLNVTDPMTMASRKQF